MKNIFQKSAMAIAVASLSVSAFAGLLTTGSASEIVLANEVFGAGSEATLVAAPLTRFTIDAARDDIAAGEEATVKFTLNKTAVFGENLSLIDNWASSNATLVFSFNAGANLVSVGNSGSPYVQDGDFTIVVDQGGEVDDNTVTFKITNASGAAAVLDNVTVAQYRTKNLTSALARGVANPTVSLGAEFRNINTTITDTAEARVIFRSQNGVALGRDAAGLVVTDYTAGGARARIDVAASEFNFTGDLVTNTGLAAAQDFDASNNVRFADLGNLFVVRTAVPAGQGGGLVKKENGDEFDFNGSDDIKVTLSSTTSLSAFSNIYLRPGSASVCTAATAGGDLAAVPTAADSVALNLTGQTTIQLENGYRLCVVAKNDVVIPEQTFTAALNVDYFNPRYTDSVDTLSYGQILRNGCSVTLFNLPTVSVGDDAYIRLTNVSELKGAVRGFVWTEDGQQIDIGSTLTAELAAHATVVLHTNEGQASGVFLGDVLPAYAAATTGRHRIVLQGAFPACEALGLIRTPSGVLVNMTSTTYSGDDSRLGSDQSGTSNTTN
jgi:hypothetical protein